MTGLCKGNEITLGLTDGTNNACLGYTASGFYGFSPSNGYGLKIGTNFSGGSLTLNKNIGLTTDATKSGIIIERTNAKYLMFFVN